MRRNLSAIVILLNLLTFSGCSWAWKSAHEKQLETDVEQFKGRLSEAERSRQSLLGQVSKLQDDLNRLQDERAAEIKRLTEEKHIAAKQAAQEKAREANELVEAQRRLAESLKQELGDAKAKLAMTERGLVLTFLDEIFFDSGKAVIKEEAYEALNKVASVLKETVPDSQVAVEGHTDNVPIKYSGWKSNWELSSGRALAVVHYFVEQQGVPAERVRAIAFGEFHPVAGNDTDEGRRQNRRVEVVILPEALTKEKPS